MVRSELPVPFTVFVIIVDKTELWHWVRELCLLAEMALGSRMLSPYDLLAPAPGEPGNAPCSRALPASDIKFADKLGLDRPGVAHSMPWISARGEQGSRA